MLSKVIYNFIMILINTIFVYILLKTISKKKYESSKMWIYIISNALVIGILYNVLLDKFKYTAFIGIALYIITSIVILKNSVYYSFVGVSLFYVLSGIGEIICYYVFIHAIGLTPEYVRSTLMLNFSVQMICYLIVLFFIVLFKVIFKRDEFNNFKFKKQNTLFIIVTLILTMSNFIYWGYNRNNNEFLIVMNVIFMTVFLFISLVYVLICESLINKNEENIELKSYIDTIQELSEELRKFKHNYLNLLYGLGGYIEFEEWSELKDYYHEVISESQHIINNDNFFAMQKIKDKALFGLLCNKLRDAKSESVNININILDSIEDIEMKDSDICQVFGIFIDNSIEAAAQSKNKDVIIEIQDEDDFIQFIVKNSYKVEPDLNRIYEKSYTTSKDKGKGFGLYIAKQMLGKYDNVLCNTYIKDDLLVQEIIIKKVR